VSFMRPNPFTQQSAIAYAVPARGARVSLRIYDINGRLVRTLIEGRSAGGMHEAVWDGRDESGTPVASGIYFCRAEVDTLTEVRKVVLIR
jgi:flagellar hook assembly protein FlgD